MNSSIEMFFIGAIVSSMFLFGVEQQRVKRAFEDAAAERTVLDSHLDADPLMDAYSGLMAWAADHEALLLDCMVPDLEADQDPASGGPDGAWQFRRFSSDGGDYYATSEIDIPFYAVGRFWGHRKEGRLHLENGLLHAPSGTVGAGQAAAAPRIPHDRLAQWVNPFLYRYGLSRTLSSVSADTPFSILDLMGSSLRVSQNAFPSLDRSGYGIPSVFYRPCPNREVDAYPPVAVSSGTALDVLRVSPMSPLFARNPGPSGALGSNPGTSRTLDLWFLPALWEGGYLPPYFGTDAHQASMRNYLHYPRMGVGRSNLVFHATVRFFMPARSVERFRENVGSGGAFFHRGICPEVPAGVSAAERAGRYRRCHRRYLLSVLASGSYDYEILLTAVPTGPPGRANRGRGEGRMGLRRVRENLREVWRRSDRAPLRQRWGYLQAVPMPDDVSVESPGMPDARRILGRSYPGFTWEIGARAPWFASGETRSSAGGRHFAANYFLSCLRYSSVLSIGARYLKYQAGIGDQGIREECVQDNCMDSVYYGRRGRNLDEDFLEYFHPPYFAYVFEHAGDRSRDAFSWVGFHPVLPGRIAQYRDVANVDQSRHLILSGGCPAGASGQVRSHCVAAGCMNFSGRRSHHFRDSDAWSPGGPRSGDDSMQGYWQSATGPVNLYALSSPRVYDYRKYHTTYEQAGTGSSSRSIFSPFPSYYPLYEYSGMTDRVPCGYRNRLPDVPPVVEDHFHAFNRACGSPALSARAIDYVPPSGSLGSHVEYRPRSELRNSNVSSVSSMWRSYQERSEAWSSEYAAYAALITRADVKVYRDLRREEAP